MIHICRQRRKGTFSATPTTPTGAPCITGGKPSTRMAPPSSRISCGWTPCAGRHDEHRLHCAFQMWCLPKQGSLHLRQEHAHPAMQQARHAASALLTRELLVVAKGQISRALWLEPAQKIDSGRSGHGGWQELAGSKRCIGARLQQRLLAMLTPARLCTHDHGGQKASPCRHSAHG